MNASPKHVPQRGGLAVSLVAAGLLLIVSAMGLYPQRTPLLLGLCLGALASFAAAFLGVAMRVTPARGSVWVRTVMLFLLPPVGTVLLLFWSWDVAKGYTYSALTGFVLLQSLLALIDKQHGSAK